MRIGSFTLDPPVVLAPMAGVTDAPFRLVCAEQAATVATAATLPGLFVSEMITARGLVEGNAKTREMIRHHPAEKVRSLQLYAAEPVAVRTAVAQLADAGAVDHIDLNFGCPVPKVTRHGGGAALPFKRKLFAAVVRAAVDGAAGRIPITVKMRIGLDDERTTYLDAAQLAAAEGVAAIALHARTAIQGYAGAARWEAISTLVRAVDGVSVLGNGDIWKAEDATAMVAKTGCAGVVIGRGCLGRPWLFADLVRAFAGERPLGPPPLGDIAVMIRRHLELAASWAADERDAMRKFRKHLRWYLQGYPVGHDVHKQAGAVAEPDDVEALLDRLDPALTVVPSAVEAPRGRAGPMKRLVLPAGWCDDPEDRTTQVAEPLTAVSGG